jgi:hypothetical protein
MPDQYVAVEPASISLGESIVSADICLDRVHDRWEVLVVFTRPPNQAPMQGQDVDAQLFDVHERKLKVLEHPSGPLVEFGGSLGNSVNALFRFQNLGVAPSRLLITYQSQAVCFNARQ